VEEQTILWIIAGIASAMLLRRIITAVSAQKKTSNDYGKNKKFPKIAFQNLLIFL